MFLIGGNMMIYRLEHPNPQWERKNWRNLNGEWEFDFDFGASAVQREAYKTDGLPHKINVPFCPESDLSGIGYKDFMAGVCYRKVITLSETEVSGKVLLHFGAIDFKSYVYINGTLATTHIGGYSSFSVDITEWISVGENVIFVIAIDDTRSKEQPCGKQAVQYASSGCHYTRTTGIWQTVWLEFVPKTYIKSAKYSTDLENKRLVISGKTCGNGIVKATAYYEGNLMGTASIKTHNQAFGLVLPLDELHLWEPGHGRLYDLVFEFGEDLVQSYFGMRDVSLEGEKFMLNGKCFFQRFVLDQGYYPDGIYTAKSDDDLKKDIELSLAAGFNGARLHQKVFEKRFLYHCDKMGYPVWGEHANWGMGYENPIAAENFICEWLEVVERDFNHPSIIGWCPFNETWKYYEFKTNHRILETVYKITKQLDPERPCIAVSGNYHPNCMEIFDFHDYSHDFECFKECFAHMEEGIIKDGIYRKEGNIQKYTKGQPVFVSEYGGFPWACNSTGWGYGNKLEDIEEFYEKYANYTKLILDNPHIMGFCYTQLYDLEQEQNGLYTYERVPKFDIDRIRKINQGTAAIEQ